MADRTAPPTADDAHRLRRTLVDARARQHGAQRSADADFWWVASAQVRAAEAAYTPVFRAGVADSEQRVARRSECRTLTR